MKISRIFARYTSAFFVISLLLCQPAAAAYESSDNQSPMAPGGLAVTDKTFTSVSISWQASKDNIQVKGYQIFRDGKKISTSSKTTYTNSNLVPGTQYTFTVRAYDAAGNVSESSQAISISTENDTKAPSSPGDLKASGSGFTTATLSWKPSTDNVGLKGYEIYCNDKKVASTSASFYEYKKLTPGISYSFYVQSCDKAGNYSDKSNQVTIVAPADKTPPDPPTDLKTSSAAASEATLAWSPSSDNVQVKGYDIIRDGIKIGTTTKTSYLSKGLFPGKSYTYTIRAYDLSGNLSESCKPLKVNTLKDIQAPTAPSDLKIASMDGASASLSWTAASDNGRIAGYQIYCGDIVIATSNTASRVTKIPFGPGQFELWVKAFDQSGNLSENSNTVTATIP